MDIKLTSIMSLSDKASNLGCVLWFDGFEGERSESHQMSSNINQTS